MPAILNIKERNYWQKRDPADFSPAQKKFIGWLEAARGVVKASIEDTGHGTKTGTTKLAQEITSRLRETVAPRKLLFWFSGVGPSRPMRDKVLPVLMAIYNESKQKAKK